MKKTTSRTVAQLGWVGIFGGIIIVAIDASRRPELLIPHNQGVTLAGVSILFVGVVALCVARVLRQIEHRLDLLDKCQARSL